jgi:two-component system invasion response regulator UvrY
MKDKEQGITMIRVLVVDDHNLVRMCITKILSSTPNIRVVGEAKTGEDAVSLVTTVAFDVILMDLKMPGIGGREACRQIISQVTSAKILLFTAISDIPFISQILQLGAIGCVSKDVSINELITAIKTVASGTKYISCQLAQHIATYTNSLTKEQILELLSKRELQIMQMLLKGQKICNIAKELGLSHKTISSYRGRLLDKLQVMTEVELFHIATSYSLFS